MSILQTRSPTDSLRPSRNWIAESLIVAGVLAFGYFAVMLETAPQPWSSVPRQASDQPLELLR